MEQKRESKTSPLEVRNTIEWLIGLEEFAQARSLTLTLYRYLPQNHPETTDFVAMVLHRTKYYQEALAWAEKTMELIPDSHEARYNYARCLHSAGRSQDAEREIRKVIELFPQWADPRLDLAMYVCSQGRADESKELLLQLKKELPPQDPQQDVVTYNLGWHLLREKRFKEGMKALCVGRKLRVFGSHAGVYPKPKIFQGLPLKDKKVLLVGEAGAGDEIINVRFAKSLSDRGAQVVWVTGQRMESLFARVDGVSKVIHAKDVPQEGYDYWAPSMDIVALLGITEDELPNKAYLTAESSHLEKWRPRIPDRKKLKVGLRWQGNPLYEQDLFRSVPLELLRPYFDSELADFYSLQRDTGLEEILPSDPVVDLSAELKTWEDTAAAISLLDVVITSCTSIAHLAGALGKKTLLFTPMISYYVWASPGEKSIWYPEVWLFRQKKFRDWKLEAEEIGEVLKTLMKEPQ